jgi:hypothetical protein
MSLLLRLLAANYKVCFQSMLIQRMRSDKKLIFKRFHDEICPSFIIISQPGYGHTELYGLGFTGLQVNSGERLEFFGCPFHC